MLILRELLSSTSIPKLAVAYGFIHTVEVFWMAPFHTALLDRLRRATGRRVWQEPVIVNGTAVIGWILKLNQPTKRAIEILDDMWEPEMSICRLHVAYDLDLYPGVTREHIRALMYFHIRLKHGKAADRPRLEETTIYFVDFDLRRGKITKAGLYYDDEPSDLDGEAEKPHIEIRLLRGPAIKREGIYRPADLFSIQPQQFWQKHVSLRDHVGKIIADTERTFTPNPYIDVKRRVCGHLARLEEKGTLPEYRHRNAKGYEKLPELALFDIQERLEWSPAKGREREKRWGKMCILSRAQSSKAHTPRKRALPRERL